jgi:hypothetical protein
MQAAKTRQDAAETLGTSPPSHHPVSFDPLVHVQDQDIDGGENPGKGNPETSATDEKNPVGVNEKA